MPENYLRRSFALLALVIAVLLAFSAVPEFSIGEWKFKKVNLLADIQSKPVSVVAKNDSVKKKPVKTTPPTDSCPPGITCIEDYSPNKNALAKFFKALNETHKRPVHIAFFGDSFIEGDILSGSFRDTLQRVFGGYGVGFVPIASDVALYRSTIQHSFSHWKTYSLVGAKSVWSPVGTAGYCFVPTEGNDVEYRPGKKNPNVHFRGIQLYYRNSLPAVLRYVINDTLQFSSDLQPSDSLQRFTITQKNAASVKFQFPVYDSLKLYGVSFEDPTGLYVDNFAMRGNSGIGLYQVEPHSHKEFNRFRDYKLILLQFGLNVVSENDSSGYEWYVTRMMTVINRLKESFPESNILLIGVSDRSSNQDGRFATMSNILLMREAQRRIAIRSHIAFWDLYAAMGGRNSMLKFVNAKPPLASKDYTHLNLEGGKKLAKRLADALLFERTRYETRKKVHP